MQIKGERGKKECNSVKLCVVFSTSWPIGSHSYIEGKGLVKPQEENKQMLTQMQHVLCRMRLYFLHASVMLDLVEEEVLSVLINQPWIFFPTMNLKRAWTCVCWAQLCHNRQMTASDDWGNLYVCVHVSVCMHMHLNIFLMQFNCCSDDGLINCSHVCSNINI